MTAVAPAQNTRATTKPARLTFGHLLRSEWIKILSLRSTWWSLGVTALLSIGISMLVAWAAASLPVGAVIPVASVIVMPMQFTMLVAGILGAIVITGEYSTGMIRSTLTAEPRRGAVLWAKAVVVALLMAMTTVVIYAVALAVTAPILRTGLDWSTPAESSVPLLLGVVAMAAFTLIGLGFGFLIRNGAGAIAATVGVLFVLPIVFGLFSFGGETFRWIQDASQYLPMLAASDLTSTAPQHMLGSALALTGWVVVPLVLGWTVLRTRDA